MTNYDIKICELLRDDFICRTHQNIRGKPFPVDVCILIASYLGNDDY